MVTKKSNQKNPLEDKQWAKEFSEDLKRDIKQSQRKGTTCQGWISEINCTSEDIGKAKYSLKSKK